MRSRGLPELRGNIGNLLPNLVKSAELTAMLPNSAGLFTLAGVRARIAENFVAIRALEGASASDMAELPPDDHLVCEIAGDWGLPSPPRSVKVDLSAPVNPYLFNEDEHDLQQESRELVEATEDMALPDLAGLTMHSLTERTEQVFLEMIDAIFTVGSAPPSERLAHLPILARARAEFVGLFLAVQLLPSASSVRDLSPDDKKIVHVVRKWAVPLL